MYWNRRTVFFWIISPFYVIEWGRASFVNLKLLVFYIFYFLCFINELINFILFILNPRIINIWSTVLSCKLRYLFIQIFRIVLCLQIFLSLLFLNLFILLEYNSVDFFNKIFILKFEFFNNKKLICLIWISIKLLGNKKFIELDFLGKFSLIFMQLYFCIII